MFKLLPYHFLGAGTLRQRLGFGVGNEPFDDACHGATIRLGAGRQITHQFRVQRACLATSRMQAPVGIQVGVGGH